MGKGKKKGGGKEEKRKQGEKEERRGINKIIYLKYPSRAANQLGKEDFACLLPYYFAAARLLCNP